MSMTFFNYLKKDQLILVLISLLILNCIYLSLEVDQSSGLICVRMDSKIGRISYDECNTNI